MELQGTCKTGARFAESISRLGFWMNERGKVVRIPPRTRDFSFLRMIQTGSGSHPTSYPMGSCNHFAGFRATEKWNWQYYVQWRPWRSRGGVELWFYSFFDLGVTWGWVFKATPRPLYVSTHYTGGLIVPRAGLDGCGRSSPHCDSITGPSSS